MTNISDQIELLGRETELASKTVGDGLTLLRKYSFGGFGYFYSGIFSLTIGLERIAKLILLIDYYKSNNNIFPPDNRFLKNLSHDLFKLFTEVRKVNSSFGTPVEEAIFQDQITNNILNILSDFARYHRYYNLDVLQGRSYSVNEPLARWEKEVNKEILLRHFRMTPKLHRLHEACLAMQPATVNFIREDGCVINNLYDYADHIVRIECKQTNSFLYSYRLVRFIASVFRQIDCFQLGEIFAIYCCKDSYAKTRKIFDPYRH